MQADLTREANDWRKDGEAEQHTHRSQQKSGKQLAAVFSELWEELCCVCP